MATVAPPTGERHQTLDIVRGVAVIGILVVNIGDFAMPSAARLNPAAWGGTDPVNLALWALNWVAFDNKMRGLFSLLFGASLLLVADRARANGRSVAAVQLPRLAVLLVLGLGHHILLWDGDILVLYALIGVVALSFTGADQGELRSALLAIFVLAALLALAIGASSALRTSDDVIAGVDTLSQARMATWSAQVAQRGSDFGLRVYSQLFANGPDTLGLMLAGMILLRCGLLTGHWRSERALRLAMWLAIPSLAALSVVAGTLWWRGFPPGLNELAYFSLAYPFNIALTVAWAAGLSAWASSNTGWLARALEATGRAAFTNYIASSLFMTTLFYGYGGGLYGRVDRAEAWLIVLAAAALMLAWSRPWLRRYRYGPLEWVWRSAARGRLQPMAGGALAR